MRAPNQPWVSDITYLWTDEGWLYLAGIKDLFSGEVVGYAMSERMTRSLVMQALFGAMSLKRPPPGLIVQDRSVKRRRRRSGPALTPDITATHEGCRPG